MNLSVIFDMDGLMLDTERLEMITCQRAGQELGFPVPKSLYLEAVGRTSKDTARIFTEHFGQSFSYPEFRSCWRKHTEAFIEEFGVGIKPGLIELLNLLESFGVPKGIATQTRRSSAERRLAAAGILSRFSAIAGGDDVKNGKPAPDLYLEAARRLDVSPHSCIAFEDSEPGIQSAHAAGMIPLLVPDMREPSDEARRLARRVFRSLHEAHPYLESILQNAEKPADSAADLTDADVNADANQKVQR